MTLQEAIKSKKPFKAPFSTDWLIVSKTDSNYIVHMADFRPIVLLTWDILRTDYEVQE